MSGEERATDGRITYKIEITGPISTTDKQAKQLLNIEEARRVTKVGVGIVIDSKSNRLT
jgi:hypothetical protein